MKTIYALNINHAYRAGMFHLNRLGRAAQSRYGDVMVADEPVTTTYIFPQQRVLFDAQRDANPFFHLIEALWMLAGLRDVQTLEWLVPRMKEFSDDGRIFHGAYGHRWRHWPTVNGEMDQLKEVVNMLFTNPNDRRVMLAMWDPERDLNRQGKDLPCNDMIKFRVVDGQLHMYVFNRSNDIIWGAYGANAVHMSVLQEYIAQMVGLDIGRYEQISCDYHAYTEVWNKYYPLKHDVTDPYQDGKVSVCPLVISPKHFDQELEIFFHRWNHWKYESLDDPNITTYTFRNFFFPLIAVPMLRAFTLHKEEGKTWEAMVLLEEAIHATEHYDWLEAGIQWLSRRYSRRAAKVANAS